MRASRLVGSVVLSIGLVFLAPSVGAQASSPAPLSDPSAHGFVGLCNKQNHQITSGNVGDQPFVWKAVSSVPLPKGYPAKLTKTQLLAFQPRPQTSPGEWSGQQLTASSSFSNPVHPMAQATKGDPLLLYFIQAFPPRMNGLIQLRMYFTAPNKQPYSIQYPATTIQVTGNTWKVIGSGTVDCAAGTAVSAETINLTPAAIQSRVVSTPSAAASASASTKVSASADARGSGGAPDQAGAQPQSNAATGSVAESSGTSRVALGLEILLVVAAICGTVVWLAIRRRSAAR